MASRNATARQRTARARPCMADAGDCGTIVMDLDCQTRARMRACVRACVRATVIICKTKIYYASRLGTSLRVLLSLPSQQAIWRAKWHEACMPTAGCTPVVVASTRRSNIPLSGASLAPRPRTRAAAGHTAHTAHTSKPPRRTVVNSDIEIRPERSFGWIAGPMWIAGPGRGWKSSQIG
jgi:hypothetical protein